VKLNPKSEARNPKQIRNSNMEMFKTARLLVVLNFAFSALDIVSDFEFRISNFELRDL